MTSRQKRCAYVSAWRTCFVFLAVPIMSFPSDAQASTSRPCAIRDKDTSDSSEARIARAGMGSWTSFIGRTLFALLFLGSGVQKLQTLDFKSGGPVMDVLSPKLDDIFANIHSKTGYAVPVQKVRELHVGTGQSSRQQSFVVKNQMTYAALCGCHESSQQRPVVGN